VTVVPTGFSEPLVASSVPVSSGVSVVVGVGSDSDVSASVSFSARAWSRRWRSASGWGSAGVVRNLTVRHKARVNGERVRVRIVQRTDPEPVSIERPGWVPEEFTPNGTAAGE